jgi:hypothetical protein
LIAWAAWSNGFDGFVVAFAASTTDWPKLTGWVVLCDSWPTLLRTIMPRGPTLGMTPILDACSAGTRVIAGPKWVRPNAGVLGAWTAMPPARADIPPNPRA